MLNDLIANRRKKLEEYRKYADPYPAKVKRTIRAAEAINNFQALLKSKKPVTVAGRTVSLRDQGKIVFGNILDETGSIQVVCQKGVTKDFDILKRALDIGDFIEVSGKVFKTKRGEKSILASAARIIAKSLRPFPDAWYGLEDVETKLRERYLDLLMHGEVREIFRQKNIFWETIRGYMKDAGFLEVETPVLEFVPGGAEAEPFQTHHKALDTDFYLRISLELPLKKLLVGGYEKVFEIGRIFRNEGIDREHLQDYTQMECYWAYADYNDMMAFVRKMYFLVVKKLFGGYVTKIGGRKIKWNGVWPKVDYFSVFKHESGLDLARVSREDLRKKAFALGLTPEKSAGRGRLIDLIFKKTVRPKLVSPCFLVNPPVDVEPLAKRLFSDPDRVERFQIVALGTELGKGFTELNDPVDQRARFEEQMKLREAGDKEAQRLDEDFLRALEYGMPPAAGFGMSERLFAVLMDRPVRETVIFPLMRPK